MKATDFQPFLLQATVWTPDEGLPVPRVGRDLLARAGWDRFDGAPIMLPLDQLAALPPEIPRVILPSANGAWRFEAAPARANLFSHPAGPAGPPLPTAEYFREAARLLLDYRGVFRMRVGRIAAVVTRVVDREDPGIFLARHFCAPRWQAAPFNRPESFEIHAHKQYEIAEWGRVNSWVRVKTGMVVRGGAPPISAVIAEQDINTPAETTADAEYSDQQIVDFFNRVPDEFDRTLGLYFPEDA